MPRLLASSLLALVLLACGASQTSTNGAGAALGERFPIRLHRPASVGERFHLVAENAHREQTVTTFRGQVVDQADATSAFRFDGTVEILAVDARGKPSELRYQVTSFVREEGQTVTELLRPGQVIAVLTGETRDAGTLRVDAAPVSEELADAIDEVLPLTRSDGDDDALFGSPTPRAVGERWQVDAFGIARGLSGHSPLRLDPGNLHGEAQILERTEVGGVDGLNIAVAIDAQHVQVDGLAQGASVREGRVTFRVDGFFPLDPALPRLRESMALHAELVMTIETPQGSADVALTMTMAGRRSVERL